MGKAPKKGKSHKKSSSSHKHKEKVDVKTDGKDAPKRGIVRIAGKDVPGSYTLKWALYNVRGFNHNLATITARHLSNKFGFPENTMVGDLPEETIEKISTTLYNLSDENEIPVWMFNRRVDRTTGKDMHVIMNDLSYYLREDIEREKKLYTWRGYRHAYGQKVRGQRTKNTGRKGMTVGVIRKSQQQATGKSQKSKDSEKQKGK